MSKPDKITTYISYFTRALCLLQYVILLTSCSIEKLHFRRITWSRINVYVVDLMQKHQSSLKLNYQVVFRHFFNNNNRTFCNTSDFFLSPIGGLYVTLQCGDAAAVC